MGKQLTKERKARIGALEVAGGVTVRQIRAMVRLFRWHGEPREIFAIPYDCGIGFNYPFSMVGIERDGYTHT